MFIYGLRRLTKILGGVPHQVGWGQSLNHKKKICKEDDPSAIAQHQNLNGTPIKRVKFPHVLCWNLQWNTQIFGSNPPNLPGKLQSLDPRTCHPHCCPEQRNLQGIGGVAAVWPGWTMPCFPSTRVRNSSKKSLEILLKSDGFSINVVKIQVELT